MTQIVRRTGINRRVFLKGVAATGAFLGFTGTASAHHGGSSVPGGCDFSELCDVGQADIMVLFDITRSMEQVTDANGETRFENAKTAAADFVQAVADGDEDDSVAVGLLTFGNKNQIGEVASPPADFSGGVYGVEVTPTTDLDSLATTIEGLNTHESGSNGTGTGSALAAVGVDDAFFDFDDDRKKYVIVLTDGEPNRDDGTDDPAGTFLTPDPDTNYPGSRAYAVEQADALRDDGVRVIAVGVGSLTGDAETFIENLGDDDPDNYYFTGEDPSLVDYTSIFESILEELEVCPVEVHIDVKYGSDPNGINPNSNGNIPVTVFGSDEFDVYDIDLDTMRFGPADVVAGGGGASLSHGDYVDQDGDGYTDFVGHFLTQETGIEMGDTVLWLYFETEDGTAYVGCDSAKTVGGGGRPK
jgi:hypothetical protein